MGKKQTEPPKRTPEKRWKKSQKTQADGMWDQRKSAWVMPRLLCLLVVSSSLPVPSQSSVFILTIEWHRRAIEGMCIWSHAVRCDDLDVGRSPESCNAEPSSFNEVK